ncbi:MAG: hypothetical protein H0T79_02370 [Deltaproteobacteria bacterium]|nr:hypothetical protein [Deltaproteobacteria bacterium]
MRFLLACSLAAALVACGAKKAPRSPAQNGATGAPATKESTKSGVDKDSDMTEERTPVDKDDAPADGADPCEGGE